MRLLQSITALAVGCIITTWAASNNAQVRKTANTKLSIYSWPLTEPKPSVMALIELTPSPDGSIPTASVFHYKLPSLYSTADEIIRVGLLDPGTGNWTGTAVSRLAFDRSYDRKFILRYDLSSRKIHHVSLQTTLVPAVMVDKKIKDKKLKAELAKKAKEPRRNGVTSVQVMPLSQPPEPVLNRPVVLDYDGKASEPEADTRSFLQKYWWAILLFVVVNIAFSAGPDDGGK